MTIGNTIASLRKERGLTQETLANELGVTNQAVSKWESDQSCPDISLLPILADFFGITLDALFGRSVTTPAASDLELPWENDETLRAVVFRGREYLADLPACKEMYFQYTGDVRNLQCAFDCTVNGTVQGDIAAGGDVECEAVGGNVEAGGDVDCGDVMGHVSAGRDIDCGHVEGNLSAGRDVDCGAVAGSVTAGGDVDCGSVSKEVQGEKKHGGFSWKNFI